MKTKTIPGILAALGIGGVLVPAWGLVAQKEKKDPAIMLFGSVLCAVFAGLCRQGTKKR